MNKVHIYDKMFVVKIKINTNLHILVDWASLAQQWIKMKETPPPMPSGQVRIPSSSEHTLPGHQIEPQNPSNASAAPAAPAAPAAATIKTFSDHNIASPVTG